MQRSISALGITLLVCFSLSRGFAQTYSCKVGEVVEGYNVDWYRATVTEAGSGQHAGYCYLKWEKFSGGQWISVKNIRRVAAASKGPAAAASATPPTTKYLCGVFLNGRFSQTQSVTLEKSGTYTTSTGASGRYRYNGADKQIAFEGGALADSFGRYEPDNHQIFRLTAKQDAAASTQSQNWRSQVCSPQAGHGN